MHFLTVKVCILCKAKSESLKMALTMLMNGTDSCWFGRIVNGRLGGKPYNSLIAASSKFEVGGV